MAKNYDMDPEYLMDDDMPKTSRQPSARRSSSRAAAGSSAPSASVRIAPGEVLVKKNPDGTYVVRKMDGKLVKRRMTNPSDSFEARASYDRAEERASATRREPVEKAAPSRRESVERPTTVRSSIADRAASSRANSQPKSGQVKIGPGETIVKRNPDGSVVVRKADGSMVKRRSSASNNTSEARNTYSRRDREDQTRKSRNSKYVNKRPAKEEGGKKKLPIFWIGLGVWVLILVIFGIYMLSYTDDCLVKYEKSQAEVAMKGFMSDFKKQVKDGTIVNKMTFPDATGELEDATVVKNIYLSQFEGNTSITYEKDPKSYDTAAPVYNIYAHFPGETDKKGTKVARMSLKSKNSKKVFAILQLVDWSIDKIEPVLTITTFNYKISVPNDFAVSVNGVKLSDQYLTGESITNPEFVNVLPYVDMPSTIQYKIEGLVNKPDIKIYDSTGAEVSYTPDDKGNIFVAYSSANSEAELTDEIKQYVLTSTQTWQDFLTNDLSGANHGFAQVEKYLIPDSYYYGLGKQYSTGPDIGFMSDHTCKDPKYTDVVVDKYIRYTDDCYSVHAKFTKNMVLTRTGADSTDTFDSTVYYVKYNGVWCIADMIATTKTATENTTEGSN